MFHLCRIQTNYDLRIWILYGIIKLKKKLKFASNKDLASLKIILRPFISDLLSFSDTTPWPLFYATINIVIRSAERFIPQSHPWQRACRGILSPKPPPFLEKFHQFILNQFYFILVYTKINFKTPLSNNFWKRLWWLCKSFINVDVINGFFYE